VDRTRSERGKGKRGTQKNVSLISAGAQRTSQLTSHSESAPCVDLNLTPSAHRGKYSANTVGEITRCIFEDGVSVPAQGKRTLRVARDCKIRMIEQIVGFRSKCNLRAFLQFECLLQGQIKLRELGFLAGCYVQQFQTGPGSGKANALGLNQHEGVPTLVPF
jgi:hypothetical protein